MKSRTPQLSVGWRCLIRVQVTKTRVKAISQSTLALLKFSNMTASPVIENGAAAVNSGTSKEVVSIATPAMDLLGEEARAIDPSMEKRVLRKIDLFLMPAMVIGELAKILLGTALLVTDFDVQAMVWSIMTRLFWGVQRSSA